MSAKKILVVEDHRDTRELLKYNLAAAGFDVAAAEDGQSGLKLASGFRPDIILLDLMMPGMDGLEVCRQLKGDGALARIPVIMLTAKGEEIDKIVGLELGADDYVVKPFSPRELVLRIKAVLRRSGAPEPDAPKAWERQGLKIDFEAHQISIDGDEVPLTATEFKLLTVLISGTGKVQTRDNLLDTVWDTHFEGYSRTVDTHVRRLRQKLGPYADWIETVRGVGYRFKAPNA
ncbi:response regulator transcription factor [uncultured Pseudodesulfovibrio sp.]|uniref:response regulator transcription factor n=1 Tax=uncultured Pseudodesulfovibrio sp. TaxID=2035858 RepID=UPI0029C62470|nr:response regulator transcription factor [uncultured Pseudodesulfovibrio sp.]